MRTARTGLSVLVILPSCRKKSLDMNRTAPLERSNRTVRLNACEVDCHNACAHVSFIATAPVQALRLAWRRVVAS